MNINMKLHKARLRSEVHGNVPQRLISVYITFNIQFLQYFTIYNLKHLQYFSTHKNNKFTIINNA